MATVTVKNIPDELYERLKSSAVKYVDARGMGIRTKVISLTRQFFGTDPQFEAGDDYLKTTLSGSLDAQPVPENVPEKPELSLKKNSKKQHVPEIVPEKDKPKLILSLISANPSITYDNLARQTRLNRKTIQRIIQDLKSKGHLERIGSARKGYWKVLSQQPQVE